ncbi:hypothetical protein RM844_04570 [Streptomyces sp. DSM 44915]|uniref:Secreted protein n=1 Tax=Streptomyces chisholmiae TaxID=3075540 RepID=A0ABU2JKQ1_9ACTN|nr:hypothetical protein [Streptomyces sp. DSM 44915]MDT0265562.1 hypothetical protein [Streptomyces sp. DSM 44915]
MPPELVASAILLVVTVCYLAFCYASPFGACHRCEGFGFHIATNRAGRLTRGKDCRRCKGHGVRIRPGRRAVNVLIYFWQHRDR